MSAVGLAKFYDAIGSLACELSDKYRASSKIISSWVCVWAIAYVLGCFALF